jgi:hypothetical protein
MIQEGSSKPTPAPPTITPEVVAMLNDIHQVEASRGNDARKARLLTITARALLTKLALTNPSVKLLLEGSIRRGA